MGLGPVLHVVLVVIFEFVVVIILLYSYYEHWYLPHKICTRFCCAMFCCDMISSCGLIWFICPYYSGLLHWHWDNHMIVPVPHDDVIKWKHFPRYWPFVQGIHRWPVNSPHKGQWRGALVFSLICAWVNSWVNNPEAGDLKCHHTHYDCNESSNPEEYG